MSPFTVSFFVLAIAACQVLGQDQFYGSQEATCIQKGGLCIQKSECMAFVESDEELCPQQAAQGFQCCYGLPKSETRCRMHGGECMNANSCNKKLVYSFASDCEGNQECCILV